MARGKIFDVAPRWISHDGWTLLPLPRSPQAALNSSDWTVTMAKLNMAADQTLLQKRFSVSKQKSAYC